jgi:hypothetical protein
MDSFYLLSKIEIYGEVAIDLKELHGIAEFKDLKVRASLESVALVAAGHSPIKDSFF